ncbi:MAG: Ig-like domain-containing protein [Sphingobacteriales bacterium]|nr:Ig-like domain-containing protein [Sphingobacteriales bacterium]
MKKTNVLFATLLLLSVSFVSCKKETLTIDPSQQTNLAKRTGGGTTLAPTVSFLYPTNGSAVTGTITVKIAAASSVGIKNTSLMLTIGTSNCLFGNDATAPYEYVWNTNQSCLSAIAPGTQVKLRATATDNNGSISYTDIYVTKQ